jgi:hypothetical protein
MDNPESVTDVVSVAPVSFKDWIDGRRLQHFSTNAGAQQIAFQGWKNFKEAFAPELIAQAYEETSLALGRRVTTCIDPFGGSGTTGLSCQFLDVNSTTIEVNPFLADLIEAKLATYDLDKLIRDFSNIMKPQKATKKLKLFPGASPTFVEPGLDGRFIFRKTVAKRLISLGRRISSLRNQNSKRLFRVLLGSISISVSNIVISGKGRRYRNNWDTKRISSSEIDELFRGAVVRAIYEIRRFQERKLKTYELIRGDARELIPIGRPFDMAVFSPPYPNSFDYTDVYNVELWVCGYLRNAQDNRKLRLSTMRSHVQLKREHSVPVAPSPTLRQTLKELSRIRAKLWDKESERVGRSLIWVLPSTSAAARAHWSERPWGDLAIAASVEPGAADP